MATKYDVIIIGGGPAGLFAALELVRQNNLKVALVEKGKDIHLRTNLASGLGGAGAFSDGKLILTPHAGGWLKDYLGDSETAELIKYVDDTYVRYGAPDRLFGMGDEVSRIARQAVMAGLHLVPTPVRHMGTENSRLVLKQIRDYLNTRIDIRVQTAAQHILISKGKVTGIETADGEKLPCRFVIVAPGREGAYWFSTEAERLCLKTQTNPVDVGVRVEVPAPILEPLTSILYEAKLELLSSHFDDRVRTFCMCPHGEVVTETTGGDSDPVVTVNGHSYADSNSDTTNFALLVSTCFTEPFHEPVAYGKYLARLANILSGGVLVQRFGDLTDGRRSTAARIERGMVRPTLHSATPGDLSFVLPYRYLTGIVEMLRTMDRMVPGIASRHTLLYGVEVKLYSYRPELNASLETGIANLFAVGDGAGISRGLVQASASGIIAAWENPPPQCGITGMLLFGHLGITAGIFKIGETLSKKAPDRTTPDATRPTRNIFASVDYRLVLLGSMLPDIFDKPTWLFNFSNLFPTGRGYAHGLLFNLVLLIVALVLLRYKKTWLLVISISSFIHLLLDEVWINAAALLWPLLGPLPPLETSGWYGDILRKLLSDPHVFVPEIIGIIILLPFAYRLLVRKEVISFIKTGIIK